VGSCGFRQLEECAEQTRFHPGKDKSMQVRPACEPLRLRNQFIPGRGWCIHQIRPVVQQT
jgi:hypothetical protein